MTQEPDTRNKVERFRDDVFRQAIVDITSKGLLLVAGGLSAAVALLIWQGGSVPAWLTLVLVVAAFVWGLRHRVRAGSAERRVGELEEDVDYLKDSEKRVGELEGDVSIYIWALNRHEIYTQHVADLLNDLQRVLAGDISVSIPDYIQKGILNPARDVLAEKPAEHVRLSILMPENGRWKMFFSAGHSIAGHNKYNEPVAKTLAGIVYESGDWEHWQDTEEDQRFTQNPKASRPTRSMISLPIRRGDSVIGTFNIVSSEPGSFDLAEESYCRSLGAIVDVAVGIYLDRMGRTDVPST